MIQEHDLSINDPLIMYFKKLAELNSFEEERHNVVKITQYPRWFSLFRQKTIIGDELPTYINQIRNIMKNFECNFDEAHVEMCYGNTKGTIKCNKKIGTADDEAGFNVNICVVYVDVACDGGELVFYDDLEPFRTIKIYSCKVVMFEGSLYHKRNDYSNGHRLCIIFQFPRK
jgi:hypothetical protein